jgi:TM2 domain-containing membrane protein YozV
VQEWYYTVNGERQGPVTAAELKKLVADGKLKVDDLVWKDGMSDWSPVKSIKGLSDSSSSGTKAVEKKRPLDDDEDDRPRKRRPADDDDDDRPRSRGRDDDDDDDDRPRRKGGVPEDTANKKMVAGILGILLGSLGIHKFYLGLTTPGIIQIVITIFTCGIGGWIGIIEGIIYLTKTDKDFHRLYVVEKKGWF